VSVISLNGIPGCGKTVSGTAIAVKYFNKQNRLYKQFFRFVTKKPIYVNNIYTNYPILLNKRHKIYSNIVSIYDLNNNYSFLPDSLIIIDEVQAFFDSYRDFKSFPKSISSFFQFHRHFGISDIYLIAQSPKRIVSYLRDVTSQYHRIKLFLRIPIIGTGIVIYRQCYDFEDYDASFSTIKEVRKQLQIKTKVYLFSTRKVFKRFKSKYLDVLNINKPLIDKGTYSSKDFPKESAEYLLQKLF